MKEELVRFQLYSICERVSISQIASSLVMRSANVAQVYLVSSQWLLQLPIVIIVIATVAGVDLQDRLMYGMDESQLILASRRRSTKLSSQT